MSHQSAFADVLAAAVADDGSVRNVDERGLRQLIDSVALR
jgi:hypothetical protein